MKAKLVGSMPSGEWIYEIKFDGYRALALRGGTETQILSRNQKVCHTSKKQQPVAKSIGKFIALSDGSWPSKLTESHSHLPNGRRLASHLHRSASRRPFSNSANKTIMPNRAI